MITNKSHEEILEDRDAEIAYLLGENPQFKNYVEEIPVRYRLQYLKAVCLGKSRANAVKMKCMDCSCFQIEEVRHCTVKTCPLWNVRPYKGDE